MSKNWFDKRDIKDKFGWSFRQFKTRLTYLDPVISGHCQDGNSQTIQVDQDGLAILKRQYELERDGYSIKEGTRKVIQELDSTNPNQDQQDVNPGKGNVKVVILEAKVKQLERYVNFLENQVEQKDQQIQQLLPGSTNGKGIIRRIWEKFW